MVYYEHNLEALKKIRPRFYKTYMEFMEKIGEKYFRLCDNIQCQKAKDGSVIFIIQNNGKVIRLNSLYYPYHEAEIWASQYDCNNIKINALLFGLGNGIFAETLLNKLGADATLYLFEPSIQIFLMALQCTNMQHLIEDNRVLFFVEDINGSEFYDLLSAHTHWTNLPTQICGYHTGYDKLFPEEHRAFLTSVEKADRMAKINKDTQIYFSDNMVSNMISNMKYIKESRTITDYQGLIPEDVPAIIVAAGPSLDKNIDRLKKAKGKAFIIAVDTALRHLIRCGIMPDAMVTLDPNKPYDYMNNSKIKNIPLFCVLESNHQILEFHKGIKIWFQGGSFLGKLFKQHGKEFLPYNPGGSVATAAFAICVALKMKRIVFVGQDLAYQGDVTHAGGEKSHILNENYGVKMIDGIDGEKVKSRYDWIIYRDWFEESIRTVQNEIHVIDATEGGALIHGTEIMTLDNVVEKYCVHEINISQILQSMHPVFSEAEYNDVREDIKGYVSDLQTIQRVAKETFEDCIKALDILKNYEDNSTINIYYQKVLHTTKTIAKYSVYDFIDIYMSKKIDKYLSKVFVVNDDKKKDRMDMFISAKMIFQNVVESVQILLPKFETMIEKL